MIKKLFIGGIIATFTLITNLFVSAYTCNTNKSSCWDFQFGEYENSNGFKGAVVDNNLNFYGLSFDYYIGDNRFLSIWWEQESNNFTGYFMTARNTNLNYNITTTSKCYYYYICNSRPPEGAAPEDYCTLSQNFSQLGSLIKNHDRYLFNCRHFGDNYLGCSVCSYNSEGGNYICIDSYNGATQIGYDFASKEYINARAVTNPYSNNTYGGNNNIRNNNQVCPTLGQILNNYDKNYNTGMCYNNTIIYNNNQIETVDKRNIQQIFTDYEELSNRRNIYNNNCKPIFTRETCMNAFSGNLDKYELISKGVNENAEPKRLRNYCNIYLNYDLNWSSCVTSGRKGEPFTPEEISNTLIGLDNLTIQTPTTGNILNGLLDEGETRANPLDILGNIEQIKDKFTILFEERKGVNGIIPNYIIWIMLLTILLTVLFKK